MAFGDKPFGLRDVKVTPVAAGDQKDVPIAQRLGYSIRVTNNELRGDDALVAAIAFAEAIDWELDAGGIDLDAYGVMMGVTAVDSGSTPSGVVTLTLPGGQNLPYFKIYGKALGEGSDDVHIKILKARLTESIEGELQGGEFLVTKCQGVGVKNADGNLLEIIQNETAADLPAS